VNKVRTNFILVLFLHLHFWGCSFFHVRTFPEPVLIDNNQQVFIRYEFQEKKIVGIVEAGNYTPEAYIFAIFHRGNLKAPIIQKMFFPEDTLVLLIAENHLNAAPEGNLAVLKTIGGDFQQEEVAFSFSEEDIILLPPFQLHPVPYYYEKQTINRADGFSYSVPIDSEQILFARIIEGQEINKYPIRGDERHISNSFDSIMVSPIPGPGSVTSFINSTPEGAALIIDEEECGKTPISSKLQPGIHTFKLIKDGYVPFVKELDIQPANNVSIDFRLDRLNTITFKTKEKGLKFILDENYEWRAHKVKIQVESGKHLLQIYKNGELIEERTMNINWNNRIQYFLPDTFAPAEDSN